MATSTWPLFGASTPSSILHPPSSPSSAPRPSSPISLHSPLPTPHSGLEGAFTLVEMILAIGLATGLLLVALTFYNQATEMRGQLLREAEQVSTMRLVLDRLAGDLRGVQAQVSPGNEFTGDSNSMSFVKLACTSLATGAPAAGFGQPAAVPTGLVRISLTTLFATNETGLLVVSGLDRSESPLGAPAPSAILADTNDPLASFTLSTNTDDLSVYPPAQTNIATEPFADIVRFVRFRYWDGLAWEPSWTNSTPPPGVEIVLSTVANPEDAQPDTYPPEAFRRVVLVPGGTRRSEPDADTTTATF